MYLNLLYSILYHSHTTTHTHQVPDQSYFLEVYWGGSVKKQNNVKTKRGFTKTNSFKQQTIISFMFFVTYAFSWWDLDLVVYFPCCLGYIILCLRSSFVRSVSLGCNPLGTCYTPPQCVPNTLCACVCTCVYVRVCARVCVYTYIYRLTDRQTNRQKDK